MMANQYLLDMKKGHIHSHNVMNVFFSGTDTEELVVNSEFYNYYLSLIVNNKNEMVAKIAFRVDVETTEKTILKYRDNEGEIKQKEVTTTKEDVAAYAYDCEIIKADVVGENFRKRIDFLREAKVVARQERYTNYSGKESPVIPFPGEPLPGESDFHSPTGKGPRVEENPGEKRGDINEVFDRRNFMAKWFLLAPDNTKSLNKVLKMLDKRFYGGISIDQNALTSFYETVKDKSVKFYEIMFPEDPLLEKYNDHLTGCLDILEDYESTYDELIKELKGIVQASMINPQLILE